MTAHPGPDPSPGPDQDPWPSVIEAVLDVAAGLDLESVLHRVVRTAMALLDAEYGALGVLDECGHLERFVHEGVPEEDLPDTRRPPRGDGLLGVLVTDSRPLRLTSVTDHPDSVGFPSWHPRMTSFIGVPVRVRDTVFGNLFLTNKRRSGGFTEFDQRMLEALAAAAGLAVENARLNASVRQVALLRERERIATDLHDSVVQQLFAVGLGLQSMLPGTRDDVARERLLRCLSQLDDTITELRATVFDLEHPSPAGEGLRSRITEVVAAETACLKDVRARVAVHGPVDSLVDRARADNLVHALRESLSNAVRHSGASTISIDVSAAAGNLTMVVNDDGIGIPEAPRKGNGLRNIARRATELGGTCLVAPAPGGGTEVRWKVPLAA